MQTNHQQIIQSPDVSGQVGVKTRTVRFTPAEAAAFLERCSYDGQRDLSAREVARYARAMKRGTWLDSVLHVAVLGDRELLVDGRHRTQSVVTSGTTQTFTIIYHPCRDDADVARLYAALGGGYIRKPGDYLNASGVRERLSLGKGPFGDLKAAAGVLLTGFSPKSAQFIFDKGGLDLEVVIEEYANAHTLYTDAIRGTARDLSKVLHWSGVMSVGLEIFQNNGAQADTFWRALATGSLSYPQIVDLDRALLPYVNGKKPSPAFIAHIVAAAWNGWNAKPYAKTFRRNIQPVSDPLFIFGSPKFTGRQSGDPIKASLQMFAGLEGITL